MHTVWITGTSGVAFRVGQPTDKATATASVKFWSAIPGITAEVREA